jgi:hydroxymethylglutaryl-CoA synthase
MSMNVGIDAISFYSSNYFMDLKTLGEVRGVDPDKYYVGIGQEKMAIPPPDEDIVTMAASAAQPILQREGKDRIEMLLFATESGIDQSKAAGVFVHGLLATARTLPHRRAQGSLLRRHRRPPAGRGLGGAHPTSRACWWWRPTWPATSWAARASPPRAAARWRCWSPPSAHSGARSRGGLYTEDVMDFWRPNYRDQAMVDGKYSTRVYLQALQECWQQYREQSGRGLADIHRFCYHLPFTRMAEKAHERLAKASGATRRTRSRRSRWAARWTTTSAPATATPPRSMWA